MPDDFEQKAAAQGGREGGVFGGEVNTGAPSQEPER